MITYSRRQLALVPSTSSLLLYKGRSAQDVIVHFTAGVPATRIERGQVLRLSLTRTSFN